MAQTSVTRVMHVEAETLYSIITDYERYPEVMPHCLSALVLEKNPSFSKVQYKVSLAGYEVEYTLQHTEIKETLSMSWELVQGSMMSENQGSWVLQKGSTPQTTEAKYTASLQLKLPVPSFVISKVLQSHLPEMLDYFEKAAKERSPR